MYIILFLFTVSQPTAFKLYQRRTLRVMISDLNYWIQIINKMFSLVRKVVAGPKNTTTFQGQQLDLTYITQRVIAMAFPASALLEKTYRNPIQDVVSYFNENHTNNYLIINVSSRFYDYTAFDGRVKDYQWPDHQAPPLATLVQIGYDMYKYLRDSSDSIVAVHCNHGKGRTGTAIISFMLLMGYFESFANCLKYYNSRRFNKNTYGVDQPCQLRYLSYIERLIQIPKISPRLICYRLKGISHVGLGSDYFVKIQYTRNEQVLFERVDFGIKLADLAKNLLVADIFIQVFSNTWKGSKRIARINCNTYFIDESMKLTFKGKDIKLSDNHHEDFQITLHLQYYCLCHLPIYEDSVCNCKTERVIQQKYWGQMIQQINECKKVSNKDMLSIVQGKLAKSQKKMKRSSDSLEKPSKSDSEPKQSLAYRSMGKRNYKSSHKQKLASLVQATIQQRMFEDRNQEIFVQKHPRIRELSDEVQEYIDEPTIKLMKVQKISNQLKEQ